MSKFLQLIENDKGSGLKLEKPIFTCETRLHISKI